MSKNAQPDAFIVTKDDGSWDIVSSGVMERYAIKADMDTDGSKQIKSDGWEYGDYLLEPLYDPEQLAELLEVNTPHAQCVDVVAREAGGLGWDVKPIVGQDDNETAKKNIRAFVESLSPKINDLFYKRNYDRRAIGYGVLEVIRKDKSKSDVIRLSHLPSQHLRRHTDGIKVKQQIGQKTVWFIIYGSNKDANGKGLFDIRANDGEKVPYNSLKDEERANELLWRMDYTPKSQYYGLAKIIPAIRAIYGDTSRSEYNTSFFKNYGMPAFAVMVSGDFEDYDKKPGDEGYDETKTLKYKISQQIKEVMKNPHSAVTILVPSEGEEGNVKIELQPLSVETKEASFRAYRKDNRDEVFMAHRVPSYRVAVNETGGLGGSNSEQSTKIYKTSVLEPLQSDDEEDINLLIKERFGNAIYQFKIKEIDVNDLLNDLKIVQGLFAMASIKPKEIRAHFGERFGLEDDNNPYLDEYYLGGKPLDQIWGSSGTDPPGTSQVLGNLENDLTGGSQNDPNNPPDDSLQSGAIKNAFNRLRRTVSTKVGR